MTRNRWEKKESGQLTQTSLPSGSHVSRTDVLLLLEVTRTNLHVSTVGSGDSARFWFVKLTETGSPCAACQSFLQHFIDHSTRGVRPESNVVALCAWADGNWRFVILTWLRLLTCSRLVAHRYQTRRLSTATEEVRSGAASDGTVQIGTGHDSRHQDSAGRRASATCWGRIRPSRLLQPPLRLLTS